MNKLTIIHSIPFPGFAQQTESVLSGLHSAGNMLIQGWPYKTGLSNIQERKRITTKKLKPSKNLSHTIQFTSPVLPLSKVYSYSCGKNDLNDRDSGICHQAN